MNVFKRLTAIFLVLSVLLISVNAEGTVDLYFNASLDLKTGETTLTESEIIGEKNFSDLLVEVTKINVNGTDSVIYSGPLGGYDDGKWANVDFSDKKPLLLYNWQTGENCWVLPVENTKNKDAVPEEENKTEKSDIPTMRDLFPGEVEKSFIIPEVEDDFLSIEYADEPLECVSPNAKLEINCHSQDDLTAVSETEIEAMAEPAATTSNSFVFNGNLLTTFNTVTGPTIGNGANEPKFSYNSFMEENISDYSGELTLNFEDLVLTGRNGLDLRIGRTYQTVAANVGDSTIMVLPNSNGVLDNFFVADYSTYLLDRYNLGVGWSFSFPSVQIETEYIPQEIYDTFYYDEETELYYHSGNGEVYKVKFTADTTDSNLEGYYNKDIQFNKNDTGYSNGQVTSYYSMTLSDKTKQYFADDGRLIGIVDRFGNTIKFEHELKSITNRVPQGTFAYNTENPFGSNEYMWFSSPSGSSDDAVRETNTSIGSYDGHIMHFRRNNQTNSGSTYILSQPIQVKPLTDYELGIRFKSPHSADINVDIIGYDTLYNLQDEATLTIKNYPANTWYDFTDTISMSSTVRYIQIRINPKYAKDMYIDTVKLDEPKPLLKKITDSIGRTVDFTYQGDTASGKTTGSVAIAVTSPDGGTKNLVYNQTTVKFDAKFLGHGEQRAYPYLNSSNTEGDDGTSVWYTYHNGATNNSDYTKLYVNYGRKNHLSSDLYNSKPVLNTITYKDRMKFYEYETVRKHLGDDGYYDTLEREQITVEDNIRELKKKQKTVLAKKKEKETTMKTYKEIGAIKKIDRSVIEKLISKMIVSKEGRVEVKWNFKNIFEC